MTLSIPVYLLRSYCDAGTPGDSVDWEVGDPAWKKENGNLIKVIIDSKRMGHDSCPGEAVYECKFVDENNKRYAVRASVLQIREGWKP